ncbi:prepilin-type N-terminal cleavage/methylation domain-containing protein [Chroococcidiopsis sp [FACHB-1243]]|uniref:prepilin-type N-terminal cleavage/methylation domain-containing protein n=1 Tax=Chroococcidiopsis sp. [FACHB-1243] TaxID=2692781 RepID=UPI0018F009DC
MISAERRKYTKRINSDRNILMQAMFCQSKQSPQNGLTILECLVAILVVSIVLAAMAPPILLAAATRLRNQRVEQAMQLAQAEIDRTRLIVERGNYTNSDLPLQSDSTSGITATSVPTSCVTNRSDIDQITKGLAIDVNKDGTNDFVVQSFRDEGKTANSKLINFQMSVRVYSFRAFQNCSTAPTPALNNTPASLTLTTGEQSISPLSVLNVQIARGDLKESFEKYKEALTLSP